MSTEITEATDPRPPKPVPLSVVEENIPEELKKLNQWVVWKLEWIDGRWTKPLYRVDEIRHAKSNDPSTWGSFQEAVRTYEWGDFSGIGFVPTTELGLVMIDLDHCIDAQNKKIEPWAAEIVARFATYVERSPIDGVRIIARGKLPRDGRKKGDVEIYSAKHYLTVTGQKFKSKPLTIEPCQDAIDWFLETYFKEPEKPKGIINPLASKSKITPGNGSWNPSDDELLDKAFGARNGDKLKRLFDGDTSEHEGDDSRADYALCSNLAFWTQDPIQIDRIFRRSGLIRDKWDEKHGATTYGELTINKALANQTQRYTGSIRKTEQRSEEWPEFQSAQEILDEPDDPLDWRWENCLPTAGSSVLVAQPKVGKSTLAVCLAISISRGTSFLGRETQQCTVAYAYLDGPKREIKQAFKKMGLRKSDPVIISAGAAPKDYVAWIIAQVEQRDVKFIVIDTFQKFFRIDNLNDYSEVINKSGPMLDAAAARNVHLLFLHHAGKGDREDLNSAIGSTAIRGQVQSYLHLKTLPDSSRRIFRSDQRHGEGNFPEVALGFDRCRTWLEIKGTRQDAEIQEAKPKIREFLEVDPKQTEKQIRAAIPIRAIIVSKALREMFDGGEVERSGEGTRGRAFIYSLTASSPLCRNTNSYSIPILGNDNTGTRIENSEKSLTDKGGIQVLEHREQNGNRNIREQPSGTESEGGNSDNWEPLE